MLQMEFKIPQKHINQRKADNVNPGKIPSEQKKECENIIFNSKLNNSILIM